LGEDEAHYRERKHQDCTVGCHRFRPLYKRIPVEQSLDHLQIRHTGCQSGSGITVWRQFGLKAGMTCAYSRRCF
jgi:hypothetical protein